jgi:iron complex outermembrane receptor protein
MKYGLASIGLAVLIFGAASTDVLAQTAPPAAAAPISEDALVEVTVTAEKVQSTEQRTPIAMSVITADVLARNNVGTLADLAQIAPSVEFSQNDGSEIITIRGVSSRDTTEIGDPDVSVDIDGLYYQRSIGLGDSIFDLERVEVLRGPQGTLYGRNAVGGAINFITAKPKNDFEASSSVEVGNYNSLQTEGMVNMPVSDSVQMRASFFTRSHSGYTNNNPANDGDDADSKAARLHVAIEPIENLNILLTGEIVHLGGVGVSINGTPLVYEPDGSVDHNFPAALPTGRTFPHNLPSGYLDSTSTSFQVHIDYSLPFGDLTYSGGTRHLDYHNLFNLDGVANVYDAFQQNEHPVTENHEIRLGSKPDAWLQWQVGVFYFDESNELLTFFQSTKTNPPTNLFTFNYPSIDTKSKAGFGQGSIPLPFVDNLRFELGVRYSDDNKERTGYLNYGTGIANESASSSSDKTTYHAALNWQVTPSNLLYLKYDTGYKAGGFTDAAPYSPETLDAVEIGAKNRWFDNKLQVNLAAFDYDYKDQQISQFVGDQTIIRNAGRSRIDGVEIDAAALITKDDRFDAYIGYLDARFTEFEVAGTTGNINLAGNAPPQAPKMTVNLGYEHTLRFTPGSLTGRVQTHIESTSYNTFFNYPDDRQGSYTRTDAFLTWAPASGKWEVQAYGRNLEDKRIIVSASEQPLFGTYVYQFADPLTYGVRFSTKW